MMVGMITGQTEPWPCLVYPQTFPRSVFAVIPLLQQRWEGRLLSQHSLWMDKKPWGKQGVGETASLTGSPIDSHQPAAGMSSAVGSDCSSERVVAALVSAASWKSVLVSVLAYNGPAEDCRGWMWVMEDLFRCTALNMCFQLREAVMPTWVRKF